MTTSINGLRELANRLAADGHLSAPDARTIVTAAGTGAKAVKNLQKVMDEFGAVITDKGKAEMLKAIGESDKPATQPKVSEATHRALMTTLNSVRGNMGEPFPSLPLGQRFVSEPLFSEKHVDGFHFTAMIPVGALTPTAKVGDPNKATSCYIQRTGGIAGLTQYFGPFDIQRGAPAKAVELGEGDDGKTIKVKKGQDFTVRLNANPTTGYNWKVTSTDRTLGYPAKEDYIAMAEPGRLGGGGVARLTWKTNNPYMQAGETHKVELSYMRTFSGEVAKKFHFTVKIV